MLRREKVIYQGPAGAVDCVIEWPEGTPRGWALVLHPHPVQGGTRDNKVVTTIARTCVQEGFVSVRPNFRGVGLSEGEFDKGVGETADMMAVVQQFAKAHSDVAAGKWVLAGFSFGTSVGAQLYSELAEQGAKVPDAVILAGAAVERFKFRDISLPEHTLLIHGEKDDVVPLSETLDYARTTGLPVVVIPDAGHFFHAKLIALRRLLEQHVKTL